jgi:hypothetical protein
MNSRRVLAFCFVLTVVGSAWVELSAQNKEQPKRTRQEQQDIETLVKLVDSAAAGQAAPSDVPVTWELNHFVKSADGSTYVPFTVAIDRSKLTRPAVSLYLRVASKQQLAAAAEARAAKKEDKEAQARTIYPWDNIYFLDLKDDGKVSRGMALSPGEYEVFIAVKDKATDQRNQPPAKVGFLRHQLTVPDFNKTAELTTSSVILASTIEPLQTPLSAEQQQENPYTFGVLRVVPTVEPRFSKTGELQFVFWVYGASQDASRKPDVQIEYNFHHKTAEGEKYFNKTAPQLLNAQTLPPQFDMAAGHQLLGNLQVPLASFPAGDYRIEIKVTDKPSGKALTQNLNFTVVG